MFGKTNVPESGSVAQLEMGTARPLLAGSCTS